MEHLSQQLSDLFGLIYRNLLRNEEDPVVLSSNSQNAILAVLYRRGPLPMNTIGEHLRVTKANITFLVDKLEKQELILRERSREDRRVIHIQLTEKGTRVIEDERTRRIQRIMTRLETLGPCEREELERAVNTMMKILRNV